MEEMPFRLIKLPSLALTEVIKLMKIREIICLSTTSKRMEWNVKHAKIKKGAYFVNIEGQQSNVNIKDEDLKLFSFRFFVQSIENPQRLHGSLEAWTDISWSTLQNTVSVFNRLQSIIPSKRFYLRIDFRVTEQNLIEEIFNSFDFQKCEGLLLSHGKIDDTNLDFIMEKAHDNMDLKMHKIMTQTNYYHRNAFRFRNAQYNDCRWVRIQYLFSMRNNISTSLNRHYLTDTCVNIFLKYWIKSDHNLTQCLQLTPAKRVFRSTRELFDGLVVLKRYQGSRRMFYLKSTSKNEEKLPLIVVSGDKSSTMTIVSARSSRTAALEILEILEKKKDLHNQLDRERNEELWPEIRAKIQDLKTKLDQHGVYYKREMPVIG